MAVSYLSRLATLQHLVPHFDRFTPRRIFIMGFPGAGHAGDLGNLNTERGYKALPAHMNTFAGNEALVLHGGAAWRQHGAAAFGLNPGLIRTGIRANYLGTGLLSTVVEALIGARSMSPEAYAAAIVPLLFAPELDAHPGAFFDSSADAILPPPSTPPASPSSSPSPTRSSPAPSPPPSGGRDATPPLVRLVSLSLFMSSHSVPLSVLSLCVTLPLRHPPPASSAASAAGRAAAPGRKSATARRRARAGRTRIRACARVRARVAVRRARGCATTTPITARMKSAESSS